MCILLVGVLLLLFELDEYEIIRIFIIRREKILLLIDWLFFNVLVNFFIKIILDVGEGILLSNFYYGSDIY